MQPLPAIGQQQEQPQQPVQQEQVKSYPASEAEAMQFSNDLMQVMYDEKTHGNIIKQLSSVGEKDKTHSVGMIAANVVGDRITDMKGQTGRPIEMEYTVKGVERVVNELASIAQGNGVFEMSEGEEQKAVEGAIQILDGIEGGK